MENEFEYYTRRAAEELQAAARARSPEAEQRHRVLAKSYATTAQKWLNASPVAPERAE